jgi:SET domain
MLASKSNHDTLHPPLIGNGMVTSSSSAVVVVVGVTVGIAAETTSDKLSSWLHLRRQRRPHSGTVPLLCSVVWWSILWVMIPCGTAALATTTSSKGKGGGSSSSSSGSRGTGFQKQVALYQPDTSPSTNRLVQVLTQAGAVLDGTVIGWEIPSSSSSSSSSSSTGRFNRSRRQRGLYATKHFKTDQVLCKIPSSYILALSDPAVTCANDDNMDQDQRQYLSMAQLGANFLTMYQDTPTAAAQWSFFLDCLPQPRVGHDCDSDVNPEHAHFATPLLMRTPDWFATDELALLELPRSVAMARQRLANLNAVARDTGIDRDRLQWATTLVSSRSFALSMASPKSTKDGGAIPATDERGQVIAPTGERNTLRVLIPYLDMVNHQSLPRANAQWTVLDPEKDDAWLALTATRPIRAGSEITRSYNDATLAPSSVELLADHGFVEAGNPMDAYMLRRGGDDILALSDWSTTLDEDVALQTALLHDASGGWSVADDTLHKILQFRIQLKQSYSNGN